jgi:hypothetical protein
MEVEEEGQGSGAADEHVASAEDQLDANYHELFEEIYS